MDETVTAGEFYKKNESVVSVISYQFGSLWNIEYECEDVAELLQENVEAWIEEMGGYDIVKPKASALTESNWFKCQHSATHHLCTGECVKFEY